MFSELGKPKQVSLKCHDESPSNSLTVCFHPAEGIPEHYILNLYKINQKGVRKHAWGPEEKMCEEFQFENLEANTQYICGVKASYKKGDGEEVEANRCYTGESYVKPIEHTSVYNNLSPKQHQEKLIFFMPMPKS